MIVTSHVTGNTRTLAKTWKKAQDRFCEHKTASSITEQEPTASMLDLLGSVCLLSQEFV